MSDSTKCPRCGGELPANFPPGVCPACLLKQGLSPDTYLSGAGSASGNSSSGRRSRWIPPTPAELAPRFPQLEIVELLGQGGMGAVYKVRQRDLDRWAALKVLPDDVAHDPNFAERFQREARALALLGHQNIVIVYEFGQREGVYYLLMEYVDGVNLRQAIRAGQIVAKDALGIVTQVCDALQFAHEEGVVHRDIKPENILIDRRGRVKIADFGLAKLLGRSFEVPTLTGTHQVIGTPVYMAPEQMEGNRGVDHRADIFSLGVVFYELLTGELPLGRFAPPSQKYSLDVRLDEVVLRTLEKEPDRRYQQASEVKGDVESIRSQPKVGLPTKTQKPKRRGLMTMMLAAVSVVLVGGFIARLVTDVRQFRSQESALSQNLRDLQGRLFASQQQYMDLMHRQHLNQNRTEETSAAERDPNIANAIVQFTNGQAKLNPAFGTNLLSAEQRVIVNQILTRIHNSYLEMEASQFTEGQVLPDGSRVVVVLGTTGIGRDKNPTDPPIWFTNEISKLENELWSQIDSQIPLEQQRFLRQNLPLFADDSRPLLTIAINGSADVAAAYPMMGGGASAPVMGTAVPSSMGMSAMSMSGSSPGSIGPGQYPANLKCEQILGWKPELLPIRISMSRRGNWYRWALSVGRIPGIRSSDQMGFGPATIEGEDPELPIGLRRFWDLAPLERRPALPESRADVRTELDAFRDPGDPPLIHSEREPKLPLPGEISVQTAGPDPSAGSKDNLEPIPEGPTLSGANPIPTPEDPMPVGNPAAPNPIEITNPRTLPQELYELDNLRAGAQTPWELVEQRVTALLQRFAGRAERGQIYWMAAHVYAQSDIRGHSIDVIRHAKMALKFEFDPVKRGWLFMYLGNAAEVQDDNPKRFVERRTEATLWYLKGLAELQNFPLPVVAPELPVVEKIGDGIEFLPDGGIEPDTGSLIVRHEAQMKARREAEITRDLVHRRETYISRLQELFGRLHQVYDKDSDATERFRQAVATVIKDPKVVEALIESVFSTKTTP